MKKHIISKLFLYRHRFKIGYLILMIAFFSLIFAMPLISPNGISNAEMQSTIDSYNLSLDSIIKGDIVNLPYHLLQKGSITLLGISNYSIKLPSIILSILLGLFLTLLLNRWFKSNVALTASSIIVLSTPFLFLSGTGTPNISILLFPTILMWLGSKIQNNPKPHPLYIPTFILISILSIFTPQMIFFVLAVILFAILHPHIRFVLNNTNKFLLPSTILLISLPILTFSFFIINQYHNFWQIFLPTNFNLNDIPGNLNIAFAPFCTWSGTLESTILSPLIGLSTLSLIVIGLISTSKHFFKSKVSIAFSLTIFTVIISGFNPQNILLLTLPIAILITYGINYIFLRWYSIFPENPYARIFALIPISIFIAIININNLSHYFFGYHYTPTVASHFHDDINLIKTNLQPKDTLVVSKKHPFTEFYKILAHNLNLNLSETIPERNSNPRTIATLGRSDQTLPENLQLNRIITSSKIIQSDRIYLYTYKD